MNTFEIPQAKNFGGRLFPSGLQADGSPEIRDWVKTHRQALLEHMATDGAVLVRGLPVIDAETFDIFVDAVGLPSFPYEDSLSNAHRISFTERVFSANEAPAHAQPRRQIADRAATALCRTQPVSREPW